MSNPPGVPSCPFCGERMYGYQIPRHVRREHDPFDA